MENPGPKAQGRWNDKGRWEGDVFHPGAKDASSLEGAPQPNWARVLARGVLARANIRGGPLLADPSRIPAPLLADPSRISASCRGRSRNFPWRKLLRTDWETPHTHCFLSSLLRPGRVRGRREEPTAASTRPAQPLTLSARLSRVSRKGQHPLAFAAAPPVPLLQGPLLQLPPCPCTPCTHSHLQHWECPQSFCSTALAMVWGHLMSVFTWETLLGHCPPGP